MKTFTKVAAQGEIKIIRLSGDADMTGTPLPVEVEAYHIVGHSETGHHHVIDRALDDLRHRRRAASKDGTSASAPRPG